MTNVRTVNVHQKHILDKEEWETEWYNVFRSLLWLQWLFSIKGLAFLLSSYHVIIFIDLN